MTGHSYTTDAMGEEDVEDCEGCGRPVYEGCGILMREGEDLASYAYRWSEGHEGRFMLAVGAKTDGRIRDGFVVVSTHAVGDRLNVGVVGPEESPWGDSETLGRVLTREEALHGPLYPDLFELVDAIAIHEPRLARRIAEEVGGCASSPARTKRRSGARRTR